MKREDVLESVRQRSTVRSESSYRFLICHTHQVNASSNVWVEANLEPVVMEMLCAYIQQESSELAHSWGMGEGDVAQVLMEHYDAVRFAAPKSGDDYYAIDLFLAWEKWCSKDLLAVDQLKRPGLVEQVKAFIPEDYLEEEGAEREAR
ncbi:hypothetical protein ACTHPH_21735 [Paenibacillus pasadenensis]|uniref:hypothetical protein n=1 Tax=Paenibacillus pasadenensis TaxID=217090 RepID=UPI000491491C|nr:hypothetical protein [Paenibacillus pasadenensis]